LKKQLSRDPMRRIDDDILRSSAAYMRQLTARSLIVMRWKDPKANNDIRRVNNQIKERSDK
jgi:hypothetical protein